MDKQHEHLENLAEIKSLMERSSTFLSLSGLAGVFAGIFAIIGAIAAYLYAGTTIFSDGLFTTIRNEDYQYFANHWFFIFDALAVFILALLGGYFFTLRKAKRDGLKMWSPITVRLLGALFIPLAAGILFCMIMMRHQVFHFVPGAALIFYGLALLSASAYTLRYVRWLGYSEILLGLIATFFIGQGFIFWIIGFGILHIVYGALMYLKHESLSK